MTASTNPIIREVTIGDCRLIQGDCLEVLPLVEADAIVTDPPYGILGATHSVSTREWDTQWDGAVDISPLFGVCRNETTILWGAQHLRKQLPDGGTWLVWDKRVLERCDAMIGSPFECGIAYPKRGPERIYRIMHGGAVSADNEPRVHPTQKPISLMRRVMEDWDVGSVCDPFMGSGTTGLRA